MYLADLLNSRGFFQRTSNWAQELGMADDISFLLSRSTSTVVSILRLEQAQIKCVREFELFEEQLEGLEDRIVFNSQSMVELQNEISPLLSSLRIMQDLTIRLVRKKLENNNIPSSINSAMKKLDVLDVPDKLKALFNKYWKNGGKEIRDYRVLDQHYSGLSDHAFLQLKPDRKVLLLFPDDPTEKSRSKFTYEKEICGISLLRVGFDDLHELIENIAAYFGFELGKLQTETILHQLGDLRPFRNRVLSLLFEAQIIQQPDGVFVQNVSAIKISQNEKGKLIIQKLLLPHQKVKELNQRNNPR